MPVEFRKQCGRLSIELSDMGALQQDVRYGVTIYLDDDDHNGSDVSVEELRDLRHLIDRAIARADELKAEYVARQARNR